MGLMTQNQQNRPGWKGRLSFKKFRFLLGFVGWILLWNPILPLPVHASLDPYEVTIEGIADPDLLDKLKAISDTIGLKEKPPASLSLLRRRMERDHQRFLLLLKAQGYYQASVEGVINADSTPLHILFKISTGPPFILQSVEFHLAEEALIHPIRMPEAKEVGLFPGRPVKTESLLDAQNELLRVLKRQGFPFPKVKDRKIIADHSIQGVSVEFWVDPGPQARFGGTTITGLVFVKDDFIRRKIRWKEGELYSEDLLEETQVLLISLGLFSTVRVAIGQEPGEDKSIPIHISVTERKHRSIGAGLSYETDEGPGAKLSWEHRNLLHRGERLGISLDYSEFTLSAEGGFWKPHFLSEVQTLRISMRLAEDKPDAYISRYLRNQVILDRAVTKTIKLGAGFGFKVSKVTQTGEEKDFTYLSLPFQLEWDNSDDLLDPTKGNRLEFHFTPFYDPFSGDSGFFRGYGRYAHYFHLLQDPSLVLAGRCTAGFIAGAERDEIPADERFYAGGGGSIRGYAYQWAGPLREGSPLGGRSLLELTLELRWKINSDVGLVGFLDAGNAYSTKLPEPGADMFWATGLGVRYYTRVGPLRIDLAFPLDQRSGIDDNFQLYVSLGQAF